MKQAPRGGQLQTFKAEFFKALAHPVRIRILEILVRGGRSVHELQEVLADEIALRVPEEREPGLDVAHRALQIEIGRRRAPARVRNSGRCLR